MFFFPVSCSGIPDLTLKILKMLIRVCFRDVFTTFLIKVQVSGNSGGCFCLYFWLFWGSMQMGKTVAAFLSILRSNVLTPLTI